MRRNKAWVENSHLLHISDNKEKHTIAKIKRCSLQDTFAYNKLSLDER